MCFETDLAGLVRARIPGIFIPTLEERRALQGIKNTIVKHLLAYRGVNAPDDYVIRCWSTASLKEWSLETNTSTKKCSWKCDKLENKVLNKVFSDFASAELSPGEARDLGKEPHIPSILVLHDIAPLLSGDAGAPAVRRLRELLEELRGTTKTVILLGPRFELPESIRTAVKELPFALPDEETMKKALSPLLSATRTKYFSGKDAKKFDDTQVEPFIRACLGLTEVEARDLFSSAIIKTGSFSESMVKIALREKAQLVRRCKALTFKVPEHTLADVSGMGNVKTWLEAITPQWKRPEEALAYGCEIPSGLLLVGIPGTGKSYTSEILARHWGLPLFRFDMASLYNKWLGETEGNFQQFVEITNACKPAVIFIDEIEKAIGGGSSSHEVSNRLKGQFLSWLQEKSHELFVVAAANDITKFAESPEILRAGRFDKIFWVGLPNEATRYEALKIHFRLSGHPVEADPGLRSAVAKAARESKGFTPAELRSVVKASLNSSFRAGLPHPSQGQILDAIQETTPIAKFMHNTLAQWESWALRNGAKKANSELEEETEWKIA